MAKTHSQHKRCPDGNALIRITAKACPECELISNQPVTIDDELPIDGPQHPVIRFLRGMGLPIDLWLIVGMGLFWFMVHCVIESISFAMFWSVIGFGIPLLLIALSGPASSIAFWRINVSETNPEAFRILAWVYLIGIQIFLVARLISY